MPGDFPTFNCIVAFLISSRVGGSTSSSFMSSWGILASEDSCTVCQSLKRPSKCSDQRLRMVSLSVSRVLPSEERRGALKFDVRVHRRPPVPRRRRACHPYQHTVVSCRQVLSKIILHGPKLNQGCTAGSLVGSLGRLIIRFCKQIIVAGTFLFEQHLNFLACFVKLVLVFSGRQANNSSSGFL